MTLTFPRLLIPCASSSSGHVWRCCAVQFRGSVAGTGVNKQPRKSFRNNRFKSDLIGSLSEELFNALDGSIVLSLHWILESFKELFELLLWWSGSEVLGESTEPVLDSSLVSAFHTRSSICCHHPPQAATEPCCTTHEYAHLLLSFTGSSNFSSVDFDNSVINITVTLIIPSCRISWLNNSLTHHTLEMCL